MRACLHKANLFRGDEFPAIDILVPAAVAARASWRERDMILMHKSVVRTHYLARPNRTGCATTILVTFSLALAVNSAAHGGEAIKSVELNSSSQGSVCDTQFRPTMSDGLLAPFEVSSRTGIDEFAPLDASAIGLEGSVFIGVAGAGVRASNCLGAESIAGSGTDRDEEVIFTFDFAVRASKIMLGLADIDWATDAPVIFLSSADSATFDYTLSGSELEAAFLGTGAGSGVVDFGATASVSPDLFIDAISVRETNGTSIVSNLLFVAPAADLDQAKNGKFDSPIDPPDWVNGNLNEQQAHYVEGYSIPYRVVMTDLPVGTTIVLTLGYDIKHSSAHAIDYLTHYQRLEPHLLFGHVAETVDPTIGVAGLVGGPMTFAIPAPSVTTFPGPDPLCDTPTPGEPTASFNALLPGEVVMSLWNGTITNIAYAVEGCLTDSNSETRINVEFVPSEATAVLAWGGHIGLTSDWDPAPTAGDISGSPYHMRLIDWDIPGSNLGNQDRSLSASAIEIACDGIVCDDNDACTIDSCDPQTGECIFVIDTNIVCDDDDKCTVDTCDAMTGECVFTPDSNIICNDDDACTVDTCDAMTGECVFTPDPNITCNDNNACTDDSCVPATGLCLFAPNIECDDGKVCTDDSCNPDTGQCVFTPNDTNSCSDGLFCNGEESCVGGTCEPGEPPCDDNIACTTDSCEEDGDTCDHLCETPGLSCPPTRTFECNAVGEFGDPTVDDDCSVDPVVECSEESTPGNLPQEETITRTCTITNDCGNSNSCVQQINIVDTTPPVIICPLDLEFECDDIGEFGTPTVTDNCDPDPEVTVEVETIIGDCTAETRGISPPPIETKFITYNASDGGPESRGSHLGNTVTCVQRIDIFDSTPPILLSCPTIVTACEGQALSFRLPTCTDACTDCQVTCTRTDGKPLASEVGSDPPSIVCRTTDECENESEACVVSIIVEDCGPVPAVSTWGMVVLSLLILIGLQIKFARCEELPADTAQ